MPNLDGMKMIDEILKLVSDQRFIIVSAHKNNEDLLKLINLRVLGYFVKPLNVDDMMQMLKKAKDEVLSESTPIKKEDKKLIKLNDRFTFNIENEKLYLDNNIVKLSKRESDNLNVLIKNIGEMISMEQFKSEVWKDEVVSDSAFRTNMKRLKDKLVKDDFIISQKGFGYIIEKPLES